MIQRDICETVLSPKHTCEGRITIIKCLSREFRDLHVWKRDHFSERLIDESLSPKLSHRGYLTGVKASEDGSIWECIAHVTILKLKQYNFQAHNHIRAY